MTELGAFMRTKCLCISVLRVASGPRVKLASCKSALTPPPPPQPPPPPVVYSTDRSEAVVPVLVLLFVALWYILQGDLFYVLPCVILFVCLSVFLALRLPRLEKRELILVHFVRLFDLCLFGFVGFLFRISKLRDILSKYREPRSFTWKQNSKLILDYVEEYARRWAKKEDVEVDTLSEWLKSVMSLVNRRVSVLSRNISRRHESVFDDQDVAAEFIQNP